MGNADEIKRVWAALGALRQHAPLYLHQSEIDQYHEQLDRLKALGYNVEEWRIPQSWFTRPVTNRNLVRGTEQRGEPQVEQYRFLTKIDALLAFFSVEDRPVGFTPSRR